MPAGYTHYVFGEQVLDQLDESIAQRLHRGPGIRVEMPQCDTDGDGNQYLHIQASENTFFHEIHPFF